MLTCGIPPDFRGGVHLFIETAIRHRVSPEFIGSRHCVPQWRSLSRVHRHRASKPRGSSKRMLPSQVTMDQLVCASLSHTHYWYERGMLKVHNRRTVEQRLAASIKGKRQKKKKKKRFARVKENTISAQNKKTPRGYNFAPLLANKR